MECGECTLCCKLLETHGVASPIGTYCTHCEPGVGCKTHDTRPEECRKYQCMWSQMENVGVGLRPDRSNIIFDRIADDVISARIEKHNKLSRLVMNQIQAFNNEGFSILIFRDQSSICFLTKGRTEDYVRKIANDRSKLHRRS